jgi:hypothetical protein
VSDEPITNYRRVRTTEGWAPEDHLSTEVLKNELPPTSTWHAYNHTRREYVSGAPWPRGASVSDKSLPPTVRWLSELRDRLWTSGNTGYQVLNLVISYALRDGADSEAALRRAVELVRVVWDRSASGTTAITAVVEGNGGDANHWDGVVRWVTTASAPEGAEIKDDEEVAVPDDVQERGAYLVRFLRGCAGAADHKELGVDLGKLMVNGDLMREAADLLEKSTAKDEKQYGVDGRDLEELRADVVQLLQEVDFWTKSASTWRERALEYWDAGGEKQEEELVERVARWACDACYSHGSFERLSDSRRQMWLDMARKTIGGER